MVDYTVDRAWVTYVDEHALPARLRQTLATRRDAGSAPIHQGAGRARGLSGNRAAWYALGAVLLVPLLIVGSGPLWYPMVGLAATALGAIAVTQLVARGAARPDTTLSAADRRKIAAATRRLFLPDLAEDAPLPPDTTEGFPVAELIARAIALRGGIADSPAWQSSYLDSHRMRLDLDSELDQIIGHALWLHSAAGQLDAPVGGSMTTAAAARGIESSRASLSRAWTALVSRVGALAAYRAHLGELETELGNAEIAGRTVGVELDIAELEAATANAEQAVEHIDGLRDEAAALALAINEIIDALNGDLDTLAALGVPGPNEDKAEMEHTK
ncbi:hypothetical protein HLB23_25720 [Nocardia uniformis]|uniref:Uncharacterized protein n=1 Tax=Nocardia uniformis TaxID=53432 RepID=A0A849C3E8_9NOCA|nr:hypothetical protein [Nocardia uniformis]NNH73214.1 hypothetical protein [Nocardia uniformis]